LGRVLTETGEVYSCGWGRYGQLGTGDNENHLTPVKITFPVGTDPIKEISAGGFYTMLDPLGPPCIQDLLVLDTPLGRVLTRTGEVYACGEGEFGRLGTGDDQSRLTPVKITTFPDGTDPIEEISAGVWHTMLDPLGSPLYPGPSGPGYPFGSGPQTKEVYACGRGSHGRLGTGNGQDRLTPVKINLRLST
jgi:alpha-tubulin suppressor-like RCC1 family protein